MAHFTLSGHEKIVEILIENGAEIEAQNRHNKTPLFLAVLSRKLNTVYVLIRHGANINTADSESATVLHVAAKYGEHMINKSIKIQYF